MISSCGNYRSMRDEAAKAPRKVVSERQFLAECRFAGMDKEKAKFNLKVTKGLGSSVLLGGKMLSLKVKRKVSK